MKKTTKRKIKSVVFYFLSWTWGLPLTLLGACLTGILVIFGKKKPKKWCDCYYIEIGEDWGGFNLGMFCFTDTNPYIHTKNHEHGHALQNCVYGIFTLFIVHIPSMVRFWWRTIKTKLGIKNKKSYDSIWFEGQATKWGNAYLLKWGVPRDTTLL